MRDVLEEEGYRVDTASHGRAALARLSSGPPPDLILLDLMMPEMDGFGFLRALRERAEWRDIPVVVLTAKEVTRAERADLERSVDRVLQKGSLDLDELRAELRRLVPEAAG